MPDVVLVHRISGLPRASFRFRLATDTLASGYALGATSCARDFHPLERAHAGHTKDGPQFFVQESGTTSDLAHLIPVIDDFLLYFVAIGEYQELSLKYFPFMIY